jgi:microcin C transport system ATP-binding protein
MGMALLFITHDLNLVRRFTHRVGVMERGRLVETGATAEVFAATAARVHAPAARQPPGARACSRCRPTRRCSCAAKAARGQLQTSAEGFFGKRQFTPCATRRWQLRRGETLGIVGESGSGKTTLGMALLALQPSSAAQIVTMGGQRIDNADRAPCCARMRRRMQVVFQDPFASCRRA